MRLLFSEVESLDSPQQILREGKFKHPIFGDFEFTREILTQFKENFDNNVRRVDLAIDYSHKKEEVAAGWIKSLELKEDESDQLALFATVEWTDNAREKLKSKEFRYLSADFTMNYKDAETGQQFGPTLFGAGLTNRPFVKEMKAILSEISLDDESQGEEFEDLKRFLVDNLSEDQKAQIVEALGGLVDLKLNKGDDMSDNDTKVENTKLAEKLGESVIKLSEANVLIEKAQKENDSLKAKMVLSEKEAEFSVMLSDGKVVEAQRKPYLAGDVKAFAEAHIEINLSESGNGKVDGESKELTLDEGADKLIALGKEKAKKDGIEFDDAVSLILSEKPELSKYL